MFKICHRIDMPIAWVHSDTAVRRLGEICWLPWPALLPTTMGAAANNRREI